MSTYKKIARAKGEAPDGQRMPTIDDVISAALNSLEGNDFAALVDYSSPKGEPTHAG